MQQSIQKKSTVLKNSRLFTKKLFLISFAFLIFLTACGSTDGNQSILPDSDIAAEAAASISEEPIVLSAAEANAPEFEMIDQAEETGDLASDRIRRRVLKRESSRRLPAPGPEHV